MFCFNVCITYFCILLLCGLYGTIIEHYFGKCSYLPVEPKKEPVKFLPFVLKQYTKENIDNIIMQWHYNGDEIMKMIKLFYDSNPEKVEDDINQKVNDIVKQVVLRIINDYTQYSFELCYGTTFEREAEYIILGKLKDLFPDSKFFVNYGKCNEYMIQWKPITFVEKKI